MPRIGDIVKILSTNLHRNRLEIEGAAVVIAATGTPHRFVVRLLDTGEVRECHVDPVAQLIGAEIYVAKINFELHALAHVATPGRLIIPKDGWRRC